MQNIFTAIASADSAAHQVILFSDLTKSNPYQLKKSNTFQEQLDNKNNPVYINRLTQHVYLYQIAENDDLNVVMEKARLASFEVCNSLNKLKVEAVTISGEVSKDVLLAFAEGLALSNYQFLKYFSDADARKNSLTNIEVAGCDTGSIKELNAVVSSTCIARDFVNEPLSYLTAEQYAHDMIDLGEELGFEVEVFNKSKFKR